MAHPYHHALASVKKWGGEVSDYMPLHTWFDQSKGIAADFRHRALRHHAEGIFMLETVFGPTITLSTGRVIPTRYVGEQHVGGQHHLRRERVYAEHRTGARPGRIGFRAAGDFGLPGQFGHGRRNRGAPDGSQHHGQ